MNLPSVAIINDAPAFWWRIELANRVISKCGVDRFYHHLALRETRPGHTAVISHAHPLGEPFDSDKHKAAHALWEAIKQVPRRPRNSEERDDVVNHLCVVYKQSRQSS